MKSKIELKKGMIEERGGISGKLITYIINLIFRKVADNPCIKYCSIQLWCENETNAISVADHKIINNVGYFTVVHLYSLVKIIQDCRYSNGQHREINYGLLF